VDCFNFFVVEGMDCFNLQVPNVFVKNSCYVFVYQV